jgi:hypothetical protein
MTKTLEDEIAESYKRVLKDALRGGGDETAMNEIDRLMQLVRDRRKQEAPK